MTTTAKGGKGRTTLIQGKCKGQNVLFFFKHLLIVGIINPSYPKKK